MVKVLAAIVPLVLLTAACAVSPEPVTDKNSVLSQGNVQMNLQIGETSKADVLENFGSPNVTTRDGSGQEVWSYQRQATVAQSESNEGGFAILLAGASGLGSGGLSRSTSGFSQSTRMMTLIINFDERDIVTDFKSRESNF